MKSAYQTQTKKYNDQLHFSVCRVRFCSQQNIHFNLEDSAERSVMLHVSIIQIE